jgi:hypothetical protein
MSCKLFGQVDIELLGTKETEVVLEGTLTAIRNAYVELEGLIDIEQQGAQNIYLEGDLNNPYLEGMLEPILELEACLTYIQTTTYISGCTTGSVYRLYSGDISDFVSLEIGSGVYQITINNYLGGATLDDKCFIPIPPIDYDTVYADSYEFTQYTDCKVCNGNVTPTPSVTPTITPTITPSTTPTPTSSAQLNYFFATRCCSPGTEVVGAPSTASTLETYTTDDGYCYQLLSTTTDSPTVYAISLIDDCGDCVCPTVTPSITPSITLTPTPTPSSYVCETCDEYNITNSDIKTNLNIIYNSCFTGQNTGLIVSPNSSVQICSCTLPYRTAGSTSYSITNNGDCS